MNMYFVPTAKVWHKVEDIAVDRTTPYVPVSSSKKHSHLNAQKIFYGKRRVWDLSPVYRLYFFQSMANS